MINRSTLKRSWHVLTRFTPILLALASLHCTARLDTGAGAAEYFRLLDVDPPQAVNAVRLTNNGNILFLSTIRVPRDTGYISNFEITICDPTGNVISSKRYGDTLDVAAADCIVLSDGSVAVVGTSNLRGYISLKNAIKFYRIDAFGKIANSHEYTPSTELSNATAIATSDNGGFVVAGTGRTGLSGTTDAVFLYLSPTGDSLGMNTVSFGGTGNNGNKDFVYDISSMEAGNWVAIGETILGGGKNNPQLQSYYHTKSPDTVLISPLATSHGGSFRSILRTGPQSYIFVGDSAPFLPPNVDTGFNAASIEAIDFVGSNSLGQTRWFEDFGVGAHSSFTKVIPVSQGGIAATGFTVDPAGDTSVMLFRLDANGKEIWPHKSYPLAGGELRGEFATGVVETLDHGFAIGGITTSFGGRLAPRQIFLLRVKADGTFIQ